MTKHALNRTSPKGQPFVGTCFQCGKAQLTLEDMAKDECENVRQLSQEAALLEAVNPPGGKHGARPASH